VNRCIHSVVGSVLEIVSAGAGGAFGLVALALSMTTRRSLKLGMWAAGVERWSRRKLPDLASSQGAQARTCSYAADAVKEYRASMCEKDH